MPTNMIIPPDMPKIEGLSFRQTTGIDDLGALLEVHTWQATRNGVDPYSNEEDYPGREKLSIISLWHGQYVDKKSFEI
jgi:hypothetical protein